MSRKLTCCGLSYTRYITICGSLLWFCYVSLEVTVTLRSAFFLCNCFRKLTIIHSISSFGQLHLFIIIDYSAGKRDRGKTPPSPLPGPKQNPSLQLLGQGGAEGPDAGPVVEEGAEGPRRLGPTSASSEKSFRRKLKNLPALLYTITKKSKIGYLEIPFPDQLKYWNLAVFVLSKYLGGPENFIRLSFKLCQWQRPKKRKISIKFSTLYIYQRQKQSLSYASPLVVYWDPLQDHSWNNTVCHKSLSQCQSNLISSPKLKNSIFGVMKVN